MGLHWTEFTELKAAHHVPTDAGVYKIVKQESHELLYVGETDNLRNRLNQHRRRFSASAFSYSKLPWQTPHYQRLEIENDLIGYHYHLTGKSPTYQFTRQKS